MLFAENGDIRISTPRPLSSFNKFHIQIYKFRKYQNIFIKIFSPDQFIRNFFFNKNNALELQGCQGWIVFEVNQGYLVQAHQVIGYTNPQKSSLSSSKFLITKAVKIGYKRRIEVVGKLVVFLNHVGAVPHGPIDEYPE